MRCISPLRIRKSGEFVIVPCGKCNFCLMTRRADWTFRLVQEHKSYPDSAFVTLTYAEDKVPLTPEGKQTLDKEHFQLFMKRLRKACHPFKLRFYCVGEYGTRTLRPHYHAILFNVPGAVLRALDKLWNYGHIHVGKVQMGSIHYVTKYHVNRCAAPEGSAPSFRYYVS